MRLSDNCFQALSPCFNAQITFIPGPAADKHMYGPHTFLNSSDFRSHKSVSIHEKLASCNASNKSYMKLPGGRVDIMRRRGSFGSQCDNDLQDVNGLGHRTVFAKFVLNLQTKPAPWPSCHPFYFLVVSLLVIRVTEMNGFICIP